MVIWRSQLALCLGSRGEGKIANYHAPPTPIWATPPGKVHHIYK